MRGRRLKRASSFLVLLLAVVALVFAARLVGPRKPTSYVLPGEAVLPEGIDVAPDGTFYVASAGTGTIYRGHVTQPRTHPFLPGGRDGLDAAGGVRRDGRGRLFVAGFTRVEDGVESMLFVYDQLGRLVTIRLAPVADAQFNDLALTRDAVYITDSQLQVVYRAALRGPAIGEVEPWVDLNDHSPASPQGRRLSGVVADPEGRVLLVADTLGGALYRIDTATQAVQTVDLGESGLNADGVLLEDTALYAVAYTQPDDGTPVRAEICVVRLSRDLASGAVVTCVTDPSFDAPSGLARDGDRLLAVNSQLSHPPGAPPFIVSAIPDPLHRRTVQSYAGVPA